MAEIEGKEEVGKAANEIVRIEVTFPVPVVLSDRLHACLHDVLDLFSHEYEEAHPDRVFWAFGEGGRMPPGFMLDEPQGDWDMSVLCIEFAERERYEGETTRQRSAIAKVFAERDRLKADNAFLHQRRGELVIERDRERDRVLTLENALRQISDRYDDQDVSRERFRVGAKFIADEALTIPVPESTP